MDEDTLQALHLDHARIRACLDHVLAHPLFVNSRRQQDLLRFIVEETLAGRGHMLKGYTLGVEVFGRGEDFDPVSDSIVRVEIGRLRAKLIEYYSLAGRDDNLVFELPKGGYAPLIRPGSRSSPAARAPSLAVLPFCNIGDDPDQQYFADGLTDDLITDLSKLSGLLVISRQSSFLYRNSGKRPEEIAAELGVAHLLTGSVRKSGQRMRITVQLVDARSGGDLWAERYDRDIEDIFAVQDNVARCIVDALQVQLSGFERERLGYGGTQNLEAHDALLRGLSDYWHFSPGGCQAAQEYFRRSLALDPTYAVAHAWLARSYVFQFSMGWDTRDHLTLDPGLDHARRAVELDDFLPLAHAVLGWVQLWCRQPESALTEGRRACALNPNDADAHLFLSYALSASGRGEEALQQIEQGIRLNPHPSSAYLLALGQAYIALEDYEKAFEAFNKGIAINPGFVANHAYLAVYYAMLGRDEEAEQEAAATRQIFRGALPRPIFTDPVLYDRFLEGYRRVGFDKDVMLPARLG